MNCLFRACSASILTRTGAAVAKTPPCNSSSIVPQRICFERVGIRQVRLGCSLAGVRIRCYSARGGGGSKSKSAKLKANPVMAEEKDSFYVLRKGDVVGVYKTLAECQAQIGTSIRDPPASVYKGSSMSAETEEYLRLNGLKNALYSIRAADLKEDLFGQLVPCTFQQPSFFKGESEIPSSSAQKKRSQEVFGAGNVESIGTTSVSCEPLRKHAKRSCVIEFDGASKGNPGRAGAGAVVRADDGSVINLREGVGTATNNVAEYRAMILGLRYALRKGFTDIQVLGDSKLVCMQIQGLWKVKHQAMSELYEVAKKLKEKFLSFKINHVLRDLNGEADAQANLAVYLADGQVEEEAQPR